MRHVAMATLIRAAFGMQARFGSGPDWLDGKPYFDIRATIPGGASARQVPEMLQSLLETRSRALTGPRCGSNLSQRAERSGI